MYKQNVRVGIIMARALIAMSGGVDSAVAALLMKENGYECIGINFTMFDKNNTLFNFKNIDKFKDINDAKAVCDKLDMEFIAVDASDDFENYVIKNFVKTYEKGGTPNPCIVCNRFVKFKLLCEKAKELDCDTVVTGHYAKIEENNGRFYIKKADDLSKDQSYVLYSLTQEQLKCIRFPLSEITKEKAREIALNNGLVNAKKSDSQDICFIPDGDYSGFIRRYTGKKYPNGKFMNTNGDILGKHNGIINYTIGQRKGLGIALGAPAYVKSKNPHTNSVILCGNDELFENEIVIENFNFMAVPDFYEPTHCEAKIRYTQTTAKAIATKLDASTVKLTFETPQRAPSKGQAAVLYDGDALLGGGTIK